MDIDIKVVTSDYEFALDLIESKRFPERRPIIAPGEATITAQSARAASDDFYADDMIEFTVVFDENSSVEEFSSWFYGKLAKRKDRIKSLEIGGAEVPVDEAAIMQAMAEGLKQEQG